MPPIQYIVEGGRRLKGTIEPSGNKNAALPIIAASLLTEHPVTLNNVPRIRDTETLVELIRSIGVAAEWQSRNSLAIHAKTIRAADLDPEQIAAALPAVKKRAFEMYEEGERLTGHKGLPLEFTPNLAAE